MIQLEHENYLVTGCAGFIGSYICEELLRQNKHVVGVDDLSAGNLGNIDSFIDHPKFLFLKKDVCELDALYFKDVDVVFHNACSKCTVCADDPKKDLMVNAWGTLNICMSAHQAGVKRVVHASTGSVMDGNPVSYYGVSKNAAENYLKAFKQYHPDFNYTILRYYHVYGPRQDNSEKGGVVPIFIKQIMNHQPITIFGDGSQVRYFTYVKDVVNANFYAIQGDDLSGMPLSAMFYRPVTIQQLAFDLCELMGEQINIVYKASRPGDIHTFKLLNGMWGFEHETDYMDGLRETIEYYRQLS